MAAGGFSSSSTASVLCHLHYLECVVVTSCTTTSTINITSLELNGTDRLHRKFLCVCFNCSSNCVGGPTCVRQVDNREENHSSSYGDSQEEQSLELMSGQSVLQVLQEGVNLQQNKHACKQTARFKHFRTETGDISDGELNLFFFAVVYLLRIQCASRNVGDSLLTERPVN